MIRAIAVLAVCSACLEQPPPPSFDETGIAMACMAEAMDICMLRTRCTDDDFNVLRLYGGDAMCLTRTADLCVNELSVADTSGSPAHVQLCATAYQTEDCTDYFDNNVPDKCINGAGPGANGSPCAIGQQCASSFCSVAEDQVCGTCQPSPQLGASCVSSSDCGRNTGCATMTGATTGVCAAFQAVNEPCVPDVMPCESGTECVGIGPYVCVPAGVEAALCDPSNKTMTMPVCDETLGLDCIVQSDAMFGTCMPIQLAQPGEPCETYTPENGVKTKFDCIANGLCIKSMASVSGYVCVGAAGDGYPCDNETTIGPPCTYPAKCVTSAPNTTAGICVVADPRLCF